MGILQGFIRANFKSNFIVGFTLIFQVSMNGYVTLTERYAENNMNFVRPLSPNYKPSVPMLIPFWTDLDLSGDTEVTYTSEPSAEVS